MAESGQGESTDYYSAANVRRSLGQLLIGKAFNAILAICIFVLIAHQLPKEEYGFYVAAFALLEFGLVLSAFGMEWVTAVYMPQYRIRGSSAELVRFALGAGGFQALAYALAGAVLFASAEHLAKALHLPDAAPAIAIYGVVLFVEGTGRMIRDQLLTTLLLQGMAQMSQSLRNVALLGALVIAAQSAGTMTAVEIGWMELMSSLLGLAAGAVALAWQLWRTRGRPRQDPAWAPPQRSQLLRLMKNAYATNIAALAYGPQVMTMLIARTLGAEATALYGFVRIFAEQVNRHLPAMLLFSILRPSLIARYAQSGDFTAFARHAALLFKLHLLALAPLVVFFAAYGALGTSVLGSHKYADAGALMAMMLLVLAPAGHRRIADMMAHTVDLSYLCRRASLALLSLPLAAYALLRMGAPLEALAAAIIVGEIAYNALVVAGLERAGYRYAVPWSGMLRLGVAAVLSAGILSVVPVMGQGWPAALVAGIASVIVFVALALVLAPLSGDERRTLVRFVGARAAGGRGTVSADG